MKIAKIDQMPELKDDLAALTADGVSQSKIAEAMGVKDRGTISEWQKRPEIQAKVTKIIHERSNAILRHTTMKIEKMLEAGGKISLENLLKIHREFAGSTVNMNVSGDQAKATAEMMAALHDDPDLAAKFAAAVNADADGDED